MKKCISCGKAMVFGEDFASGDTSRDYCSGCANPDGTMKTFEERLKEATNAIVESQGLDWKVAYKIAEETLKKQMPSAPKKNSNTKRIQIIISSLLVLVLVGIATVNIILDRTRGIVSITVSGIVPPPGYQSGVNLKSAHGSSPVQIGVAYNYNMSRIIFVNELQALGDQIKPVIAPNSGSFAFLSYNGQDKTIKMSELSLMKRRGSSLMSLNGWEGYVYNLSGDGKAGDSAGFGDCFSKDRLKAITWVGDTDIDWVEQAGNGELELYQRGLWSGGKRRKYTFPDIVAEHIGDPYQFIGSNGEWIVWTEILAQRQGDDGENEPPHVAIKASLGYGRNIDIKEDSFKTRKVLSLTKNFVVWRETFIKKLNGPNGLSSEITGVKYYDFSDGKTYVLPSTSFKAANDRYIAYSIVPKDEKKKKEDAYYKLFVLDTKTKKHVLMYQRMFGMGGNFNFLSDLYGAEHVELSRNETGPEDTYIAWTEVIKNQNGELTNIFYKKIGDAQSQPIAVMQSDVLYQHLTFRKGCLSKKYLAFQSGLNQFPDLLSIEGDENELAFNEVTGSNDVFIHELGTGKISQVDDGECYNIMLNDAYCVWTKNRENFLGKNIAFCDLKGAFQGSR